MSQLRQVQGRQNGFQQKRERMKKSVCWRMNSEMTQPDGMICNAATLSTTNVTLASPVKTIRAMNAQMVGFLKSAMR